MVKFIYIKFKVILEVLFVYKDRPISVPFEFPRSSDGRYYSVLTDDGVLKSRRKQLGLTQQEVADLAHIQLSQYQRPLSPKIYFCPNVPEENPSARKL